MRNNFEIWQKKKIVFLSLFSQLAHALSIVPIFPYSKIYLVHRNANFNAKTIKISDALRAELTDFLMYLVLLCALPHTGEGKI